MARLRHVLGLIAALCALGPAAAFGAAPAALEFDTAIYGPPPAHASLYSFSDVYRLTLAGAAMGDYPLAALGEAPALAESAQRVAAADGGAGYVFAIHSVPARERWMLLLAGLAAACWVAWRRLWHPI